MVTSTERLDQWLRQSVLVGRDTCSWSRHRK